MRKRALVLALLFGVAGFVLADDRSTAEHDLEKAIASQSKADVKTALAAATSPGDARAAKVILAEALKLRGLGVHEALLSAIEGIKDDAGVKELAEAARKNPQADLRYLLVEGLARQGSDLAQKTVVEALDDKDENVSTIAARSARSMRTPATIERLIARLKKAEAKQPQEASLTREINGALCAITGQDMQPFEWEGWWQTHKSGWKPGEAAKRDENNPGTTVIDRLKKERPEDAHTIERLADDDVIVVKGHSDEIERVLDAIQVKHKTIAPEDLAKTKLDPKSVLCLNCNSRLNPYGESEFAKIREFVEKGGYFFSSDWQLEFLLGKVFPGAISLAKKVGKDNLVVPIQSTREGSRHPFMRDVFPMATWDQDKFTWHIDSHSELIKIESPGVTVLVESPELQQKFGNGAVAVTFRWDRNGVVTGNGVSRRVATGGKAKGAPQPRGGCVLHVLGHFKHQKDKDSGDHFALQQLLLNFFLEKKHGAAAGKS